MAMNLNLVFKLSLPIHSVEVVALEIWKNSTVPSFRLDIRFEYIPTEMSIQGFSFLSDLESCLFLLVRTDLFSLRSPHCDCVHPTVKLFHLS